MSSRKIKLSSYAKQDLKDILKYTRKIWGLEQQNIYKNHLDFAVAAVARDPRLGRNREEYFAGCYIYHVERHLIVYKASATRLDVIRVLHDRSDIRRHIPLLQ